MKRLTLIIVLLLFYSGCSAQSINDVMDRQFAFQVKQIDEFFERFNFDNSRTTFLKKYLENNNSTNRITFKREFFIKSLFLLDRVDTVTVKEFISFVDNSRNPILLSFYDNDWFALLSCDFNLLGRPKKVQLILKNQVNEKEQSKWVIYSVKSEFFKSEKSSDSTSIMSPMSHAVDFMTLNKAFSDKANSSNYFKNSFHPDELSIFYFLVQNNILKFEKLDSISYYLFQVPDWFLKVDYINRQSGNSGWLISHAMKMSSEDKIRFKKENLNVSNKNE